MTAPSKWERATKPGARRLAAFAREDAGASVVEYALLLALIAVVVVAAVSTLGARTNNKLSDPALANALS